MSKGLSTQVHVNLEPALKAAVEARAAAEDRSLSAIVRRALIVYLNGAPSEK